MNTTIDRVAPDAAVIALDGELDASNFRGLVWTGQGLYTDGVRRLALDLSKLTYMASSGIVALHSLALVFRGQEPPDPEQGWSAFHDVEEAEEPADTQPVRLVAPTPAVDRVLERTGLKRMLPVYDDAEAALAG